MTAKRVAIQGYKGCFHEEASRLFYAGTELEMVECDTFEEMFAKVRAGEADAIVMAIENTLSGGLIPNFELLRKNPQAVKGETYLRIEQNLMALPGTRIEDLREVRSHYMAINQTRKFFKAYPGIRLVESDDTAKSAMVIAREGLAGVGAIGSRTAAEEYGLEILASGIETNKHNFTRFLVLDDALNVPSDADKASLCFTLPHTPGSLARLLSMFSIYGLNLTRIQSLPIPGREWQYFFYVDVTFTDRQKFDAAMTLAVELTDQLRSLGEYKSSIPL